MSAGQKFGRRYTIIQLLGSGAMGAVYQAWDETLGTTVALKLIRVDAGIGPAERFELEERFKRELKLARQVTHPNVVRIHDLGEVDDTVYLMMAYVRGENLATILARNGRLPIGRALHLARQVVSGLAAAHRAGVVHRDLKPANVMVDVDDHALLMDFGIARSTTAGTMHTRAGAIIGTLDYMAPEQARGQPVDERTDVYSCGLILYELLAGGRPPVVGVEGGLSNLIARLDRGTAPLRTVVPDVPAELDRIVGKCLSPNPANRYANASDLLVELEALGEDGRPKLAVTRAGTSWRRVAALLAAGAVVVATTWWVASRRTPAAPPAARAPIPVLIVDFDNRAREAVFEGALEQALSIAMEETPFVTAFPRKDAASLLRELRLGTTLNETTGRLVANREGIPVILAGTVDRSGSGYRLTVTAMKADEETPITVGEATAADKGDVLAAVQQLARRVRTALGDTTLSARQQAETFTASSLEAVQAYTVAQDLAFNNRNGEAVARYREAIGLDPEFGRAYSGLGASLLDLGRRHEAEQAYDEALRRLDRMSEREKLRTLGGYYLGITRNYAKAIETYQELVSKYPADSAGYNNIAVTFFSMLNFTTALEYGRKALAIYPKSVKLRANYALFAMYAGDLATAETTAAAIVKEDPSVALAYIPLASAALAAGDTGRARAIYTKALKSGADAASLAALGLADLAIFEGRPEEAVRSLPEAIERDVQDGNTSGAVAKLIALAEVSAARGQSAASQSAVARARSLSDTDGVLLVAARSAIAVGRLDEARRLAAALGDKLPVQGRAYGKVVEAEIAMASRQYPVAIDALNAAHKLADLWMIRYELGLAYFNRGDYPEAASEFQKCRDRRGEASAVFLDDLPTFRYYAPVPYWLGRAREMQKLDPRPQYEEFLRIRGAASDQLAQDARRRLDALRTPEVFPGR